MGNCCCWGLQPTGDRPADTNNQSGKLIKPTCSQQLTPPFIHLFIDSEK